MDAPRGAPSRVTPGRDQRGQPQRVHPGDGRDVGHSGYAGIALGQQPGNSKRLARQASGHGAAQRRLPLWRARQHLAHRPRPIRGRRGDKHRGYRPEAVAVRGVRQGGRQRLRLARVADSQLRAGTKLHDEVRHLIGDPPPDVAGVGPLRVVEETVGRWKRARSVPIGIGQRHDADVPSGAVPVGGIRLEPAHRIESHPSALAGAVEPGHDDEAPCGR